MLPLEVGDEVIEVMLIPDKPAKDELVMLVTTAGVKIKQPLDRLMEHFWHEAYKCTAVQGISSTWHDSRVGWLAVVPNSAADSASCDRHIAPLDVNVWW